MQFLLNLRIPFMNDTHGYTMISGPTQSLIMETCFWAAAVLLYSHFASKLLRRYARKLPYWRLAKQRAGVFCGNGQDDSIVLTLWGIHHLIAGTMMLVGLARHDHVMWRHGYLLETGFEIADIIAILVPLYPYQMEGVKPELKPAAVFHHACGILLAHPILTTVLCTNEHLQAIAMWLLLGASVSCFSAVFIYTLDMDQNMLLAAAAFVGNCLFFLYCRFYQFPFHSYHLLQDVHQFKYNNSLTEEDENFGRMEVGAILKYLYGGLVCMGIFNLCIAADLIPKMVRYVRRAADGVTPLESAPVPRSRDSIHWRRASVLEFMKGASLGERSSGSHRLSAVLKFKSVVEAMMIDAGVRNDLESTEERRKDD